MFALTCLLASLFPVTVASGSPVQHEPLYPSRLLLGSRVTTPLGVAQGTIPINGASRFAVKYASAQRWRDPVVASTWEFPCVSSLCDLMSLLNLLWYSNNSSDPTALPLACPQSTLDPSEFSEDCLSMLLYAPTTATSSKRPVFFWFVFDIFNTTVF